MSDRCGWSANGVQVQGVQRVQNPDLQSCTPKYPNEFNGLHGVQECNSVRRLINFALLKSHSDFNELDGVQECKISSLKGRCHPQKRGVAPSREPIWWDDG